MADITTTNLEENLINRVLKEGLECELSKYYVLRIAIAKALNLPKVPLDADFWEGKKLRGEKKSEYHLEQITGKGKEEKDDFDLMLRALFYIQHKEELDSKNQDIFTDEKLYLSILNKYIHRGLFELQNSWKNTDCFYQWCLDNLNWQFMRESKSEKENKLDRDFTRIERYFKKNAIAINLIKEYDSYRHYIYRIEVQDSTKIKPFEDKSKYLNRELGCDVNTVAYKILSKAYDIQISKPEEEWLTPSEKEFQQALAKLQERNDELGIFAGMDIDKNPFCFDLKETPHLFVAGTTGSGKSVFLKNMILCLLQNKGIEITIIDPKKGVSFREFENIKGIEIIKDNERGQQSIQDLIETMENRYESRDFNNMNYKVLIIDELNDLIDEKTQIKDMLKRLAQKARESKIHLVLGTQRPDGSVLRGLKTNIPSSIAFKTKNSNESKIILDDNGAEKLLGKGDMLIQLSGKETLRALSVYLSPKEIQRQLDSL
ncbi:FtsK/SpoIIIE domain-containing protein [Helicobacter sp. MIT 14-3879]|uniref:FtsK/SpoIIIE domain-containing protein n=1 Tax=Helicobacter sp. MIT 14-3879 TaxID=2040649 RepID=UPI000E1E51DC|nr:FtsK/SpoIIIE domain-containing protein [Helicobacter sp. MIT 14-3879]RDU60087.1 cell division protein FtsK [Helicobacter sp. MIT 14-3879]